jgi:hypothetical protein
MLCIHCGLDIPQARAEAGYVYCMDKTCVSKALSSRQANLRLVLMPKQGFTYVFSDSPDLRNNNKSSGR